MTKVTWMLLFSGMLLAGFPFLLITTWGHGIPWVLALACLVVGVGGAYTAFVLDRRRHSPAPPKVRSFR